MLSGVSAGHISYLERGERKATIETLAMIASGLNIKVENLYKIIY